MPCQLREAPIHYALELLFTLDDLACLAGRDLVHPYLVLPQLVGDPGVIPAVRALLEFTVDPAFARLYGDLLQGHIFTETILLLEPFPVVGEAFFGEGAQGHSEHE